MKRISLLKQFLPIVFIGLFLVSEANAQCNPTNNNGARCPTLSSTFGAELAPTAGCDQWRSFSSLVAGHYFRMPVLKGGCYSINTCGTGFDTQLTFFQGNNTTNPFAWRDDNGPHCSGTEASMDLVPNFTDYTRFNANKYNCVGPGASSIMIRVRQNNNLTITSSSADMCEGETRPLTATPARDVVFPQPNSGNRGTFSGVNVQDTTFYANAPSGNMQTFTITYRFGFCSTTQQIDVYKNVNTATAGPDQTINPLNTTLAGNTAMVGTGLWTVIVGSGTFANANDPATAVTGLNVGLNRFVWTISNGPCISTDTVDITVSGCDPVGITSTLINVSASCSDTIGFAIQDTGATPITYQWQESTNGGATWTNLSSGGSNPTYAGANADSLTLAGLPVSYDTYQYRCYVDNACGTDTSNIASISVVDTLPPVSVCPATTPIIYLDGAGSTLR